MSGKQPSSRRRRFKILLIALAAVVLLSGLVFVGHKARRRMMAQSALTEGTAAYDRGDWDTARKMLGRYVAIHPEDKATLEKYAEAQLGMRPLRPEHMTQAIGAYRQIFNEDPKDERIFRRLSVLCESVGDYGTLAHVAGQRLERVPDDPPAVIAQAKDLLARQKPAEALSAMDDLITKMTAAQKAGPDLVEACVLAAAAVQAVGKPKAADDAQAFLQKAIEREPACALALIQRAAILREATQPGPQNARPVPADDAGKCLEQAGASASSDPRVHLGIAREWLALRDYDRADKCLQAARQIDPGAIRKYIVNPDDWTSGLFEVSATLSLMKGSAAEAIGPAEQVLQQLKDTPQRTQLLPLMIELYLACGKVEDARGLLQEYGSALELHPNMPDRLERVAYLKARIAAAEGQFYKVIELLEPVVGRPYSPAPARSLLAMAYAQTGQTGRMARLVGSAPSAERMDAGTRKRLARWHAQQGDWSEARAILLPLEQEDPTDAEARALRLWADFSALAKANPSSRTADLAKLAEAAASLRDESPRRVDVRALIAAIAEAQGQPEKAVKELVSAAAECDEPAQAQLALARLYASRSQFDEAQKALESACGSHGETAAPWLALGDFLVDRKLPDAARSALRRGAESVQSDADKRQLLIRSAALQITGGDRAAGIAELSQLAKEDPQDLRSRVLLLEVPDVLQDEQRAQQLIKEIEEVEGSTGLLARFHQARLWLARPDWRAQKAEIESRLKYCIGADPQWANPALVLGGMYEQLADWAAADNVYSNGYHATGSVDLANRWLAVLQRLRRFEDARKVLAELRQVDDQRLGARQLSLAVAAGGDAIDEALMALQLRMSGPNKDPRDVMRKAQLIYLQNPERNGNQALADLDEAAAAGAEPVEVAYAKAVVLRGMRRPDEALKVLDDLVSAHPRAESYLIRGSFHEATGKSELAERDFAELAAVSQDALGPAALGEFYARAGRLDEAVTTWEKGLSAHPDSEMLKRGLVKVCLMRDAAGDRERVHNLLTELERAYPGDTDTELVWVRALYRQRIGDAKARELLPKALSSAPAKAEVYRGLARLAGQLEDQAMARDLLMRGLQANPEDRELTVMRAQSELRLGNPAEARRVVESVVRADPGNVGAWEVLVVASALLEDKPTLQRAADGLRQIMVKDPTNETALVLQAQALASLGEVDAAQAALEAFQQNDAGQRSLPVLLALQQVAIGKKDYEAAERWLQKAAEVDAEHPTVAQGRLRLLATQGRYDEVAKLAGTVAQSTTEWAPDFLVAAAAALAASPAHRTTTLDLCRQATVLAPQSARYQLALGEQLYQGGDLAAAEQAFRQALQLNPAQTDAKNNLAWVLATKDPNSEEALRLSQEAVKLRPNDANLHDTLAYILRRRPNGLKEAREELFKVLALAPSDSRLRGRSLYYLAQVCVQLNDAQKGAAYSQDALSIQKPPDLFTTEERVQLQQWAQAVQARGN